MSNPRKPKKLDDRKPLETASDIMTELLDKVADLSDYCNKNGITAVMGFSCYDRLTREEPKEFFGIGPDTSVLGLSDLLSDYTREVTMFGPEDLDDNDGDDGIGRKKSPKFLGPKD